jgi:hypothetical protein
VLLQARQVLRRGSSCEVSARFFATYAGGYAIWLLYGLSIGSLPLILVDAAGLLCGLVTLGITLRLRGSLRAPAPGERVRSAPKPHRQRVPPSGYRQWLTRRPFQGRTRSKET